MVNPKDREDLPLITDIKNVPSEFIKEATNEDTKGDDMNGK